MYEGFFSPLHLLILLLSAVVVFGLPIYLVFFIVRKVNQKYPSPPDSGKTGHR
jgi:hypothetical protein